MYNLEHILSFDKYLMQQTTFHITAGIRIMVSSDRSKHGKQTTQTTVTGTHLDTHTHTQLNKRSLQHWRKTFATLVYLQLALRQNVNTLIYSPDVLVHHYMS